MPGFNPNFNPDFNPDGEAPRFNAAFDPDFDPDAGAKPAETATPAPAAEPGLDWTAFEAGGVTGVPGEWQAPTPGEAARTVLGVVPKAGRGIVDALRGGTGLVGQALEGMTSETGPQAQGNPVSRYGRSLREEAAHGTIAKLMQDKATEELITPKTPLGRVLQAIPAAAIEFAPATATGMPGTAAMGLVSGLHSANTANEELASDDPSRGGKMVAATGIGAGTGALAGKLMPNTQPLSRAFKGAPWQDGSTSVIRTELGKWLMEASAKLVGGAAILTGGQVAEKKVTGGQPIDTADAFLQNLATTAGFVIAHGAAQARAGAQSFKSNEDGTFSFKAEAKDPKTGEPVHTWVTAKVDADGTVRVAVPLGDGTAAWVKTAKIQAPEAKPGKSPNHTPAGALPNGVTPEPPRAEPPAPAVPAPPARPEGPSAEGGAPLQVASEAAGPAAPPASGPTPAGIPGIGGEPGGRPSPAQVAALAEQAQEFEALAVQMEARAQEHPTVAQAQVDAQEAAALAEEAKARLAHLTPNLPVADTMKQEDLAGVEAGTGDNGSDDLGGPGGGAPEARRGPLPVPGADAAPVQPGAGGGEAGASRHPAPALPKRVGPLPPFRLYHGSPVQGLTDLSPAKGVKDAGNAQYGTATYGFTVPEHAETFRKSRGLDRGEAGPIYSYQSNIKAPFDFRPGATYTPEESAKLGIEGLTRPVDGLALRRILMDQVGTPDAFAKHMLDHGYDGFVADYNGKTIFGAYAEGHAKEVTPHAGAHEARVHARDAYAASRAAAPPPPASPSSDHAAAPPPNGRPEILKGAKALAERMGDKLNRHARPGESLLNMAQPRLVDSEPVPLKGKRLGPLVDGEVQREAPKPWDAVHPKAIEKYEAAMQAKDVGLLAQYLHPTNFGLRAKFESDTGVSLKNLAMKATREAIEKHFAGQEQGVSSQPGRTIDAKDITIAEAKKALIDGKRILYEHGIQWIEETPHGFVVKVADFSGNVETDGGVGPRGGWSQGYAIEHVLEGLGGIKAFKGMSQEAAKPASNPPEIPDSSTQQPPPATPKVAEKPKKDDSLPGKEASDGGHQVDGGVGTGRGRAGAPGRGKAPAAPSDVPGGKPGEVPARPAAEVREGGKGPAGPGNAPVAGSGGGGEPTPGSSGSGPRKPASRVEDAQPDQVGNPDQAGAVEQPKAPRNQRNHRIVRQEDISPFAMEAMGRALEKVQEHAEVRRKWIAESHETIPVLEAKQGPFPQEEDLAAKRKESRDLEAAINADAEAEKKAREEATKSVALGEEGELSAFSNPLAAVLRNLFGTRQRPDSVSIPSAFEEVERRWREAKKGAESTPMLTKAIESLRRAKAAFTRHFDHIDPNESPLMAQVHDILRQYEAGPAFAKAVAHDMVYEVTKGLGPKRIDLFTRVLVLRDIIRNVEHGVDAQDDELPFGYANVGEARFDLERFEKVLNEPGNEAVKQALQKRHDQAKAIVETLVNHGLLNPDTLHDVGSYYHRQVMTYLNSRNVGTTGGDVRVKRKGFQIARQGGANDFSAAYEQAEAEWVADAMSIIVKKESLDRLEAVADLAPRLRAQANQMNLDTFTERNPGMTAKELDNLKPSEIAKALGEDAVDWRSLAPEGYTLWQPAKGNHFYPALTISERLLDQFLEGEAELSKEDFKHVLALGSKKKQWAIPQNLATQLDYFVDRDASEFGRFWVGLQSSWKQWQLISPFRILRYSLNNMMGDLDIAVAYDPRIVSRHFNQAAADMWAYQVTHRASPAMVKEIQDAIRRGVVESGITIAEIPDIDKAGAFRLLTSDRPNGSLVQKVWGGLKTFSTWRENILRLAAYRFFQEELGKGRNLYAASNRAQIDAIKDQKDRAAKLARELIGDYGNVSVAGQYIRTHMIPFYSWMEVNAPRYVRLLKNLPHEGEPKPGEGEERTRIGAAGRALGVKAPALALRAAAVFGLIYLFNQLFFKDEYEELRRQKGFKNGLILGRREDGSIRYVRMDLAITDALEWFSASDLGRKIMEVRQGKETWGDIAADALKGPAEKIIKGWEPFSKTLFELVLGRSISFPSVWREGSSMKPGGMAIRDKAGYVLKNITPLDRLWNKVTNKPERPASMKDGAVDALLAYSVDPGEASYFLARDIANDWMKKNLKREEFAGTANITEKGNALYYFKRASQWGDKERAAYWLGKYYELGGKPKDIRESIKRGHPIGSIPPARRARFMASLDAKDREVISDAIAWYQRLNPEARSVMAGVSKNTGTQSTGK